MVAAEPRYLNAYDLRLLFKRHLEQEHNLVLMKLDGGVYEIIQFHTALHLTRVCNHGIWLPDLEGDSPMTQAETQKLHQAYPSLTNDQLEVLAKFQTWTEGLTPSDIQTFKRIPNYETYVSEILNQQMGDGANARPINSSQSSERV